MGKGGNMIETFVITLVSILIGYTLGYIAGKHISPDEVIKETYQKLKQSRVKVGSVVRPSAQSLNEDPLVKAEKDAMRESFRAAGIVPSDVPTEL